MAYQPLFLRPIGDTDLPLLTMWLAKKHVLLWYEDPNAWIHEIQNRHADYSWIHHFIVMRKDQPIGFCQYYDCFSAAHLEDWYHVDTPHHTFSIDYFIGEETYLHKGYGKTLVALLTEIIKKEEHASSVIVQPDKDNYSSIFVLLHNGYIWDEQKKYYYKNL